MFSARCGPLELFFRLLLGLSLSTALAVGIYRALMIGVPKEENQQETEYRKEHPDYYKED